MSMTPEQERKRQQLITHRKAKWKKRSSAPGANLEKAIALGETLLYDAIGCGADVLVTQDIELHLAMLEHAWEHECRQRHPEECRCAFLGVLDDIRREAPPPEVSE